MAVVVTPKAVLIFALKREAEPLVWRFGLYPFWDETHRVYAVRSEPWEEYEPPSVSGADAVIGFAGMGPTAAATEARRLLAAFPRPPVVLSVGIAGGLRPGLGVGDVVVPSEVVSSAGRWMCAPFLGPTSGRLLTVDRVILGPAEKQRLADEHVADLIDMEAAGIAAVCHELGVPFAAVKAVCDPFDTALPRELPDIAPDGRPRVGRLLWAMLRRPRLIGELMRLDRASRRAAWAACERAISLVGQAVLDSS